MRLSFFCNQSSSRLQAMPSGSKRGHWMMNHMMPLAAMSMAMMSPNFPMMIMPVQTKKKGKTHHKKSNEIIEDQLRPSCVPGCLPGDVPFGFLTQVDREIQEMEENSNWHQVDLCQALRQHIHSDGRASLSFFVVEVIFGYHTVLLNQMN